MRVYDGPHLPTPEYRSALSLSSSLDSLVWLNNDTSLDEYRLPTAVNEYTETFANKRMSNAVKRCCIMKSACGSSNGATVRGEACARVCLVAWERGDGLVFLIPLFSDFMS